jgi:hypothetical protein
MLKKKMSIRRASVLILVFASVVAAMGYGIAQNTVVTQAEWAVYMVRALKLDWNLPQDPKSQDYIARLNWQANVDVSATGVEPGSSSSLLVEEGFVEGRGPTSEALYRVSTIRTGDYGFRLRMANGGAVVKVGNAVFEAYQPDAAFQWVDLNRVSLDAGDHSVSVLFDEGTRADMLGVSPPCLIAVEPPNGWQPLQPLTFGDLAVTISRTLELEYGLPGIGPEIEIKGEEFTRLLEVPIEEEGNEETDPFWLSSGGALVEARTRFVADEPGLYAIQARYFSPSEIRWAIDGCLRAITCPVQVSNAGLLWTNVVAVELEAGPHDIGITLPPKSSLDRIMIQRKDGSVDEYMGITMEEGFTMRGADEPVSRRHAINAALRLRSLFERWKNSRCRDTIVALEETAALLLAAGSREERADTEGLGDRIPNATASASDSGRNPVFPADSGETPVASPIKPGPGS